MPSILQIAQNGAMVLLMGLLIGLERQHSQKEDEPLFAGFRTFPVVALTGFLSALMARAGVPWVLPVALAGVAAVAVAAYYVTAQGQHKGATTELVAILTFVLGALAAFDYLIPAAIFAVVTTLLLSMKAPLHQLAEKIQEEEMYAILKFAIVTVIVLPLLPDRAFGPFEVLNPRLVWWMVVLISAVSMLGYVLMRFMGARQGIAVTGFLGGLASSTAVTFGLSEKAREAEAAMARYFALGLVIASTIMYFRVWFLALVIYPSLAQALVWLIGMPALVGVGVAVYLWRSKAAEGEAQLKVKNPMDLGQALKFALLFAVVLFVATAAHHYFGSAGVYIASALAGLTDVDAITVSMARLARENVLVPSTANASILLACAMNTLVKGGIAVVIGGKPLRPVIAPIFLALFIVTLASCLVAASR
ncbi:MAG: MgtC/SapB family protein [Terriglobia bacterium]